MLMTFINGDFIDELFSDEELDKKTMISLKNMLPSLHYPLK